MAATGATRDDGRPDKAAWAPLRDAAVVLALGTAFLYVAGHSYLVSKYWRLGITAEELAPSTPSALMASFFPLLAPVVLLVLAGVLCLSIRKDSATLRAPFAPLSSLQVLLTVFGLLSFKLLLDVVQPEFESRWLLWHPRDILFLGLGLGLLAWQYVARVRLRNPSKHVLSWWTNVILGLSGLAFGLVVVNVVLTSKWQLDATQTALLIFLMPWTALLIYGDIRRSRKSSAAKGTTVDVETNAKEKPSLWSAETKGSQLFLGLVIGMAVVLSAGLRGNVEAGELVAGCDTIKTVMFDPMPASLTANHTYWMVLHDHGSYYVRDLNATWSAGVWVIPEHDGMTAHTNTLPARRAC